MNEKSDLGTPELQARGIAVGYNADGDKVASVMHQRRIDTLWRRGSISQEQWGAANQILKDAFYAGLQPSIKSSCNLEVTGGNDIDSQLDAHRRYMAAMRELKGYEQAVILWVVLDDGYLKDLKSSEDNPLQVLKDALDILAIFYGIKSR